MHAVCSTDRVTLLDTYQFDDSVDDEFHREPYCVKFRFNDISCPPNTGRYFSFSALILIRMLLRL